MKRFILLFSGLLLFLSSYSQKKWSLQDCIDYALENNIQVKREKLLTLSNEKDYIQSKFQLFSGRWVQS